MGRIITAAGALPGEMPTSIVSTIDITIDSSGDINPLNPYSLVWTDTVLRVVHGFNLDHPPFINIMDADGIVFTPPVITRIDANTLDIDFGITITGEWLLTLSDK